MPTRVWLLMLCQAARGVQICGDALAFYTQPGLDFTLNKWAELDNCIYQELVSVYERGQRPGEEELRRIVEEFRAGRGS
jgi:hypothetical protein